MKKILKRYIAALSIILFIFSPSLTAYAETPKHRKVILASPSLAAMEGFDTYLEMYQYTYEYKGAKLTIAENGEVGLEQYFSHQEGYFKIILMDIHMPVMNGLEATQAIRNSGTSDSRNIPIIAVTANSVADGVSELEKYGLDDYIPKPIDAERLYKTINSFLQARNAEI